ncbi:MAG: hypothetical protein J6Y39_04140 [Bacteroidaceae bacterium]|nr:hypothetical protein [Bacteroidaceae bacterium]
MKKILMVVVAMVMAVSANAQNPDKGMSWAVEIGAGTELEIGGRLQKNFNKYFAWDVAVLKYAFDYNPSITWYDWNTGALYKISNNWHEVTIQTGVRGFSPKYYKEMKAFAALDMGYGAAFGDGWNSNHFALDFTIGTYVVKGLYVGYGLGVLCANGNHTDHLVRIGYNF